MIPAQCTLLPKWGGHEMTIDGADVPIRCLDLLCKVEECNTSFLDACNKAILHWGYMMAAPYKAGLLDRLNSLAQDIQDRAHDKAASKATRRAENGYPDA